MLSALNKTTTIRDISTALMALTPLAKSLGVTHLSIIGSCARLHTLPAGHLPSDLDILAHWKSKHHWAANSNTLSEFLSCCLKIKIDLTAPFHHFGCNYDINKIPAIRIF